MRVVTPELIHGKRVLIRMDIDVPIQDGKVVEDYRLQAGVPTLELCLQHAQEVIVMGHIGRPGGVEVPALSVEPVHDWFEARLGSDHIDSGRLRMLENLRFDAGEDAADSEYAKELAALGDFYINEAFASHHAAASTTVLASLLPHAAGLHFAKEVEILSKVRENPDHPLVAIIGGAKIEDKLPIVDYMSKIADTVMVGGKLVAELNSHVQEKEGLQSNVMVGELTPEGEDLTPDTITEWGRVISQAKMVVWNGPVGYVEKMENYQSGRLAQMIIDSGAQSIIGGGDTVTFLNKLGLLEKFTFVSTGGGAMLKFLTKGSLPTIEALADQ